MPLPMNSISESFHLYTPSFGGWQKWLVKAYFTSHLSLKSVSLFTLASRKLITIFQMPGDLYSSFPSFGSLPNGPVWPFILPGGLRSSPGMRLDKLSTSAKEGLFPGKTSKILAFLWFLLPPQVSCIIIHYYLSSIYSLFKIPKYLHFKRELYT